MVVLPAAPPSRLGDEAVVTEDEPHPSPELVTMEGPST
jgi:hypothetical protein